MKIGMLWFDNNPRMGLHDKIAKARDYYRTKYGKVANMVFVHPSMTQGNDGPMEYEVRTSQSIMPNHFWVGVDADARVVIADKVETPQNVIPGDNKKLSHPKWSPLEE